MTYPIDFTLPPEILEQIATEGFDILPELIQVVVNTARRIERQKHLGAAPFERSPERPRRWRLTAGSAWPRSDVQP